MKWISNCIIDKWICFTSFTTWKPNFVFILCRTCNLLTWIKFLTKRAYIKASNIIIQLNSLAFEQHTNAYQLLHVQNNDHISDLSKFTYMRFFLNIVQNERQLYLLTGCRCTRYFRSKISRMFQYSLVLELFNQICVSTIGKVHFFF